jgi:hypothetical protein
VRRLCRLLEVHPSGYYAWCQTPRSAREIEDERLTGLIKQFWLESGGIYGYRKIQRDLRDIGERCGKHRVRRLMKQAGLKAQVGYRRPRIKSGLASVVAPNRLQQQFVVAQPNETWVSDITHTRRLVVLGGDPGFVLAPCHWLVDAITDQEGTGARCAADGGVAPAAESNRHRAYRSGQPVH